MAVYVINVSIDAPDGYVTPNRRGECREDLSVNEVESIGELVLESLLGFNNAVPEHDESNEEEDQLTKIFMDWTILGPSVNYPFTPAVGLTSVALPPFVKAIYGLRPTEINTPPPQYT